MAIKRREDKSCKHLPTPGLSHTRFISRALEGTATPHQGNVNRINNKTASGPPLEEALRCEASFTEAWDEFIYYFRGVPCLSRLKWCLEDVSALWSVQDREEVAEVPAYRPPLGTSCAREDSIQSWANAGGWFTIWKNGKHKKTTCHCPILTQGWCNLLSIISDFVIRDGTTDNPLKSEFCFLWWPPRRTNYLESFSLFCSFREFDPFRGVFITL